MVLISIVSDFCLGINNLELGSTVTIKYKFIAHCSLYLSLFQLYDRDSTDSLDYVSSVIPIEHRKQITQGHPGLI